MAHQEVALAEMFGRLARALLAEPDPQSTLQRIVDIASRDLAGCEAAGVSLIRGRKITASVWSGKMAERLGDLQNQLGEGPCLDTLHDEQVYRTGDLPSEDRWPQFSTRAHDETGARSVVSIRLFIEHDTMGALNMYSRQADAFDDQAVAVGTIFATHAAVALAAAWREENLERKADSRDLIGRAKGILMSQRHIDDAAAFRLLRDASQHLNRKLTDVAAEVERTGDLPPPEGRPAG